MPPPGIETPAKPQFVNGELFSTEEFTIPAPPAADPEPAAAEVAETSGIPKEQVLTEEATLPEEPVLAGEPAVYKMPPFERPAIVEEELAAEEEPTIPEEEKEYTPEVPEIETPEAIPAPEELTIPAEEPTPIEDVTPREPTTTESAPLGEAAETVAESTAPAEGPNTESTPSKAEAEAAPLAEALQKVEKKRTATPRAPKTATPKSTTPSKRGRKSLKQVAAEADLIEIPTDEVLFSKQYYTMGEVSEMFRVNQSLLRFWESEFDILQPRKNKKGDRYFRPADIKNLHLIYHLLRQKKYTIEGAKEFLKNNKKAEDRFEVINRLQEIRAFLLEWKAQL